MFLKNFWYVAAWDHELADKPLGRTILSEPVVLFRDGDGQGWCALEDKCPHRRVPLSMGKVVDGELLQCHYHGLRFDELRQVRSRSGPGIDPGNGEGENLSGGRALSLGLGVDGRPGAGRSRETIPDYHYLDSPDWGAKGTYIHVKANWQLIVDNLLDLTHLAFVHESTIGNAAVAENAEVRVKRTPGGVLVTRWMIDKPAPPTYVKAGNFTGNVDRWQFIDFPAAGFPAACRSARRRPAPARRKARSSTASTCAT